MMRVPVLVVYLVVAAMACAQLLLPDRPFQLHGPPLKPPVPPRIYSIRADVYIYHAYAKTRVEYVMFNLDEGPMEVEFAHSFPPNAYVTDFQMTYGNGLHKPSKLKVREDTTDVYVDATHGGITAETHKNSRHSLNFGHSNYFGASTYVQSFENVTFKLEYEELLQAKFEKYEYQLELRPQEVLESLNVILRIVDTKKIVSVVAPAIGKNVQNKENKFANISHHDHFATVSYNPTKWLQRDHHSKGINGVFRVQWQTEAHGYGDYKIGKGHFAYYFSPALPMTLRKHMILVMDTSDSMVRVESQLTAAMQSLMSILEPGDKYTVIEFGSFIKIWKGEKFVDPKMEMYDLEDFSIQLENEHGDLSPADYAMRRISQAKKSIFQGSGSDTNLNIALDAAFGIAQSNMQPEQVIPFIVLMTDGKVSAGERNFEKIIQRTRLLSTENVPIFSLAMGEKAEEEFLNRLSSENYGFSIRIKENDPDVSSQLEDFLKLMQPIVGSLTMDFKELAVHDSVSSYTFRSHFSGSEKIVTGKLIEPTSEGSLVVYLNTAEGSVAYEDSKKYRNYEYGLYDSDWFLERIWAYNTIKDMIKKMATMESLPEIHAAQRRATEISLKYNFASEFTSLLVRSLGHLPNIKLEAAINLNGPSWSDEGPVRETTGQSQFGFLGGLALPFVPQIIPFHQLIKDDLRKKFDWPVPVGVDGTTFLQGGKVLKLGFGKVNLPYGDSCTTKKGHDGICKLVHFCETEDYSREFDLFTENTCRYLDANIYDGVCCPLVSRQYIKHARDEPEYDKSQTSTAPTTAEDSTTSETTELDDESTNVPDTTAFTEATEATDMDANAEM